MSSALPAVEDIKEPLQRMAFGSCNDQYYPQPMWDRIRARDPQLWLWLGDTIYGDYREFFALETYIPPFHVFRDAPPEMLRAKYKVQLENKNYTRFREQVPMFGIWDDHDYGKNDGDRRFAYRKESQELFLDFFDEPRDSPRRKQEGVYAAYTVGSGAKTVKFILLDVRFNKDPYDQPDGDFLGEQQWKWLEKELVNSKAAFTFVVSGIQVLPDDRIAGGESWGRFPAARERLLSLILNSQARGVAILSGDVHFAEINQVQCNEHKNLVTEITSSGLTHSWDTPRDIPIMPTVLFKLSNTFLPWEFRPHLSNVYADMHYGELLIDWDATPVPMATIRIIGRDERIVLEYNVSSHYFDSDPQHSSNPGTTCRAIREELPAVLLLRRILAAGAIAVVFGSVPLSLILLAIIVYRRTEEKMTTPRIGTLRVMAAAALLVATAASTVHGAYNASRPSVADITKTLDRVAFGSCNDQSFEQPLWTTINQHKPELWVWMGDNIYGDIKQLNESRQFFPPRKMFRPAKSEVLRSRYAWQHARPGYQELVDSVPVIGIWDDHDFGINDGDKGYFNREQSQQIFLDFMNEPDDSPRRKQQGIYASYTVGKGDQTVKFILVDNRFNRDPYGTPNGDFLGEKQWQWLEGELMNSKAAFNVIVSGIQILPADRFFGAESWHRFPAQRERLLKTILASNAKGVILLSGDVHFSELNQVVCSDGRNVMTEITSSGMTHSWMEFHVPEIKFFPALIFTYANMILPWEFRPTAESYYGYLNWGQIDFDWTSKPHPVATVSVFGADDTVKLSHQFISTSYESASPELDAQQCKPPRPIGPWETRIRRWAITGMLAFFFLSIIVNALIVLWVVVFLLNRVARAVVGGGRKSTNDAKKTQKNSSRSIAQRSRVIDQPMPDLVELFRRRRTCRRIYDKRVEAIYARELELRKDNALREEIERNMKDFVATSIQCRYRGWVGRCIAAVVRRRYYAAIQIERIVRGFLARRLAARERRLLRQVVRSPLALKLLLERSVVVRTIRNWQEMLDSHTNEYYYFHIFTHDSQWAPPEPYQEFLQCNWPNCDFVAKTVHEIHEHYRTIHVWYCPVCMAKVCTSTFPRCPICQSICSHDAATGEILGPGDTQLSAIEKAKAAEEALKKQQEEMEQTRMSYWAELAALEEASHSRRPRRKRLASVLKNGSPLKQPGAAAGTTAGMSEEDQQVAKLTGCDDQIMNTKWVNACYARKRELKMFAKALLPFGSLYVGDFDNVRRKFDGMGEIMYVNGDRFIGAWKDNRRNGPGIFQSHLGHEYIGEWVDGLKHGRGIETFATGERYMGEFVRGKFHGLGSYFAANGDKYEGTFVDGSPHGHGMYRKVNGDTFVGTTIDGRAEGLGVLSTSDGEVYKGNWKTDYRHGRGVCYYSNGAVYSGAWWNGRWSGHGIYVSAEGIKYIGEFVNGLKHGPGKLVFENGDVFDGHFVHGMAEGEGSTKGIYRFRASGNTYVGGWRANKRHGKGTYMFHDGSRFTGYFENDHAVGRGVMQYANGNVYKGAFLNAEKHGHGVYNWQNGSVYVGEFTNGVIHGVGKLAYASGHEYSGGWAKNKRHGKGKFIFHNRDVYDGEWFMDQKHGRGTFVWNPGTPLEESYDGQWDHDKRHGSGTYRYANGTVYDGDWHYGKREGIGTFSWPNGDVYHGQFDNEMQHGFGTFRHGSNGDVYEGEWKMNIRDGHGKLIYADGRVFEGAFEQGRRHGPGVMTYVDGNCFRGLWQHDKKQGDGHYVLHVEHDNAASQPTSQKGNQTTEQHQKEAQPRQDGTLHMRVFGY
ncbi:TPA: hypothetical protein N0F65_007193 [Lagenidium giganteum]|uniref:WW domain-containing protein n=1 Tax=Lagenidium giganteum TaxID=4803 RepID=A0AAV2ZA47_9STRA|nr:TPA: hypothetical protein N0F65_007193 [Lagenidium giganteum]